jgi:hypothetical protein
MSQCHAFAEQWFTQLYVDRRIRSSTLKGGFHEVNILKHINQPYGRLLCYEVSLPRLSVDILGGSR